MLPLIFTDLDGCLLNKADYRYDAARPTLKRILAAHIPLILCSSKTQAEMRPLANELGLKWPFVCENGGVIVWNDGQSDSILGTPRSQVLEVLKTARRDFNFRTFSDLEVTGLMKVADLSAEQAANAINRQCTEPLLWDDQLDRIEQFRQLLSTAGLHLTQGGRFWHIAGQVSKGDGMQAVTHSFQKQAERPLTTIAIGDSPIDRPMLEIADIAVLIPQPDGNFLVSSDKQHCVRASQPGAAGWATEVTRLLDDLGC